MSNVKLLVVDRDATTLADFASALDSEGYELLTARTAQRALDLMQEHAVAVIAAAHDLPDLTGTELLAQSIIEHPNAVRMIIAEQSDVKIAQAAVNFGRVGHFLVKPCEPDLLRVVIRNAVRHHELEYELRRLNGITQRQNNQLEEWNQCLEAKVTERTAALRAAYDETLNALVLALDSRERETAGHSRRVAAYCVLLAIHSGVPDDALENLYRGALLHDIGKIGVPDEVLLAPGRLDDEQRRRMEAHVRIGAHILDGIGYLTPATAVPRYHHERFNGSGYAEGLAGHDIPIAARVFAIVDVYDALRSERPYKASMAHEQARAIIAEGAGSDFDPRIVQAFLHIPEKAFETLLAAATELEHFQRVHDACAALHRAANRPTACAMP